MEFLKTFISISGQMAPFLILGFVIAGILHAFVPQKLYNKTLAGNNLKSILYSVLFGVPLPLCSCGVVPTAVAMRKKGASRAATTAFLISTPQTGVDSIAATWSMMGLPFAILRPIAALISGIFGGLLSIVAGNDIDQAAKTVNEDSSSKKSFTAKIKSALAYGLHDMVQDLGKWLIIGLVLATLITIFVPDNFFADYTGGSTLGNYLIILGISIPMYVCATGSIPIAAALILKGLSPGAALLFLMAGPATNVASMLIISKSMGKRNLAVYLAAITIGAAIFGLITDYLLPQSWFEAGFIHNIHSCHQSDILAIKDIIWAAVLFSLTAAAFIRKNNGKTTSTMKTFKVKGMVCNHCKANVERTLKALDGVEAVTIDLASGSVEVEGSASDETIVNAITNIGYEVVE